MTVARDNYNIDENLKIFIGKKSEIIDIRNKGAIEANKWYLAWDKGEIFIATPSKKLIQYGGTANNLSEENIREIVKEYTDTDLKMLKSQLTEVYNKFNNYSQDFHRLKTEVSNQYTKILNDTDALVKESVNRVLAEASSITYSKEQIDSKINAMGQTVQAASDAKYQTKSEMTSYATKTYADNLASDKVLYKTGDNINSDFVARKSGVYFCTLNSSNSTFLKAHMYYLHDSSFEDLTPEGSGGGGTSTETTISLRISGQNSIQILIGESYSGSKSFSFTCSNPSQIEGNLSFYAPGSNVPVTTVEPDKLFSTEFIANLLLPDVGTYEYKLSGIDKNGNTVSGTASVNVYAPVYFGAYGESITDQNIIKTLFTQKGTSAISGTYTVTTNTNEYIWICVPQNSFITNVTMNGFRAPFDAPVPIQMLFNTKQNIYNCYRTSLALDAGVYTLVVS